MTLQIGRIFVVVNYDGQEFGRDIDIDNLPRLCEELPEPLIIGAPKPGEDVELVRVPDWVLNADVEA